VNDLTIVIPAYNEEKGIEKTILTCKRTNPKATILVIDDCSTDNTAKITKNLKKQVKNLEIISHKKNKGYGGALATGFSSAKTKYVAFLDADLTYHPRYLPVLLDLVIKNKLDCAWGNRFGKGINHMPLIRKFGNRILVFLFLLVNGRYVSDISCGERVFDKKSLEKIDYQSLPTGLDMITAMTKRIVTRRLRYKLIPIEYPRRHGASKLNIFKDFINMARNILVER
jgi:glycosyltransferase involved in cell wall biosynthesis